jgi:hypothetical protein
MVVTYDVLVAEVVTSAGVVRSDVRDADAPVVDDGSVLRASLLMGFVEPPLPEQALKLASARELGITTARRSRPARILLFTTVPSAC